MFKFTIRELLLLTLVAALGVGWGVREFRLGPALKNAEECHYRWIMLTKRWKRIEDDAAIAQAKSSKLEKTVASLKEENDGLRLEVKLLKKQLLGDE